MFSTTPASRTLKPFVSLAQTHKRLSQTLGHPVENQPHVRGWSRQCALQLQLYQQSYTENQSCHPDRCSMWRYLQNAKEPPPKKRKTDGEKTVSRKEYEDNQRVRTFQQSWMTKFSTWLRFEADRQLMFCTVCEKYSSADQNFVKGCASMRLESLRMHERSQVHANSLRAAEAATAAHGTTPVVESESTRS